MCETVHCDGTCICSSLILAREWAGNCNCIEYKVFSSRATLQWPRVGPFHHTRCSGMYLVQVPAAALPLSSSSGIVHELILQPHEFCCESTKKPRRDPSLRYMITEFLHDLRSTVTSSTNVISGSCELLEVLPQLVCQMLTEIPCYTYQ
jgi:hypothetical protein